MINHRKTIKGAVSCKQNRVYKVLRQALRSKALTDPFLDAGNTIIQPLSAAHGFGEGLVTDEVLVEGKLGFEGLDHDDVELVHTKSPEVVCDPL